MDNKTKQIETLLECTVEYGKSGYELVKLKTLDKTSDIISSLVPFSIFILLICTFLIFSSFGAAFWLGEILNKVYFGFFAVAIFYGIIGIIIYFTLRKYIKSRVCNYIIKQVLK